MNNDAETHEEIYIDEPDEVIVELLSPEQYHGESCLVQQQQQNSESSSLNLSQNTASTSLLSSNSDCNSSSPQTQNKSTTTATGKFVNENTSFSYSSESNISNAASCIPEENGGYSSTDSESEIPTDWDGDPVTQKEFARSWHNEKLQKDQRDKNDFMLIAGNANIPLARKIAKHLGVEVSPLTLSRFRDGETKLQIVNSCRGKDMFIIQPTSPPVNENLMDLLILIATARRASAKRITAVLPYYGYSRADRKNASRIPIAAADVAKLLEAMGVDRVVSVDLHCGAIQGFFPPTIPMDNLSAMCMGEEYFLSQKLLHDKVVIVSPDAGGVYRAKTFQEGMIKRGNLHDVRLAMLVKQRSGASEIARMDLVGTVEGYDVILVDDMIDTAGTMCEAASILRNAGAKRIFGFATHGVLSGPAIERIQKSELEELVITDSVFMHDGREKCDKIKIISLAVLIADGIRRIYLRESLSWQN